jgi:hypothetical protein
MTPANHARDCDVSDDLKSWLPKGIVLGSGITTVEFPPDLYHWQEQQQVQKLPEQGLLYSSQRHDAKTVGALDFLEACMESQRPMLFDKFRTAHGRYESVGSVMIGCVERVTSSILSWFQLSPFTV